MTVTRIIVPLSWAEYGAFTSVKILLEHGAKINSTGDMYSTPLSWLIHAGSSTAQMKDTEALLRSRSVKEKVLSDDGS